MSLFSRQIAQTATKRGVTLLIFLLVPLSAYADEDDDGSVKTLGWVAIGAGTLSNVVFVVFNRLRKVAITTLGSADETASNLSLVYKPMLNLHIMLNSVGYFAGLVHGYSFINSVDAISLSLVIIMTVLMVSGIMLRYTSSRNLKIFNRLLHGQFILAFLLIALVVLHVVTGEGDD
jgi:hypothetical protein